MAWTTPDAPTQDELDACVTCGLCLPHCPTYRLTGDETASPRGRLAAMSAVAAGEAEVDAKFADLMEFCLQCRACETACPSLVPFGRAMEGARAEIATQLPSRGRAVRRAVVGKAIARPVIVKAATFGAAALQRIGLARKGGLVSKAAGLRSLQPMRRSMRGKHWPAVGRARGRAALLTGCVMDEWFQDVHSASVMVLRRAGYDVESPAGQVCCGALAAHEGATSDARRLAERNAAAFSGFDIVVADAAGCGAHLKEYENWTAGGSDIADRAVDITEVVAERLDDGSLPTFPSAGIRVAVQDPCHLRHAQRIVDPPRRIVAAAGYEPVDLDPAGRCCGAAGFYTITQPETSETLGRVKAEEIAKSTADIVVSANPGCEMQLRTYAPDGVRIVHPVELYAERLAAAEPA